EKAGTGGGVIGIALGWVTHGLLSLKAHVARGFAALPWLRHAEDEEEAPRPRRKRVEPRLVPSDEPETAEEGDEEDEGGDAEAPPSTLRGPPPRAPRAAAKPPARKSSSGYEPPALALLAAVKAQERFTPSTEALQENAAALETVLGDFGVRGEIINARPGPVVTLYELEPAPGIKSSRVIGLADDIARSMSAVSARVAVVSGRNAIGIELPNPTREKVFLRELLSTEDFNHSSAKLPLCLGKTIGG